MTTSPFRRSGQPVPEQNLSSEAVGEIALAVYTKVREKVTELLAEQLAGVKGAAEEQSRRLGALGTELHRRIADLEANVAARIMAAMLPEMQSIIAERVAAAERNLTALVGTRLAELSALLRSLPTPQVVIPPEAIRVEAAQPEVQVFVPPDSVRVEVAAAGERTPKKTTVEKTILYDRGTGRPDKIIETTTEQP